MGKKKKKARSRWPLAVPAALLALVAAAYWWDKRPLAPATPGGELVVLTREGPATYYLPDHAGQAAGLEHDLIELFARQQHLKVRYVLAPDNADLLAMLAGHQAHLAAGVLPPGPLRDTTIKMGPAYRMVQEQVVCRIGAPCPRSVKDLVGKRVAAAGSNGIRLLGRWQQAYPALQFAAGPANALLKQLAAGELDAVVARSDEVKIEANLLPNLVVAFNAGMPQPLRWMFPADVDPDLVRRARAFFAQAERDGTVAQLLDQYYGHIHRLSEFDVRAFQHNRRTLLPQYQALFIKAQDHTDIDWRLIAAQSYQESHWDALATSPTGVRGLMMLTQATADELDVHNRLDPRQNISAGARYLSQLKSRLPAAISEPDRTWIALAAYNVGYGHIEDARLLARHRHLNPNSWADLAQVLPLLTHANRYHGLMYGSARGNEPVIYVANIRTYYGILQRHENAYAGLLGWLKRWLHW
jgi:membrane-bound lytic murein transglycosylase F